MYVTFDYFFSHSTFDYMILIFGGYLRVPYTFSMIHDQQFYFSVIHGINLIYVHVNLSFDFFMNVKSCFEFSVMHEKAK